MRTFTTIIAVLACFLFFAVPTNALYLYVSAGTYTGNITLDKSVNIIGDNAATTIIVGSHTATLGGTSFDNVTLEIGASIGVTLDSSGSAINSFSVTNCILNLGSPGIGIWLGGGTPTNPVSNVVINNNMFNGPGSMIANPWKIGGQFSSPLNCQVTNVDFTNNIVDKCSTPINLGNANIDDILIDNNIYSNTDGCVYVWDDRVGPVTGVLSNFVFSNNDVDGTNSYGVAFGGTALSSLNYTTANAGAGNAVSNNNFIGITDTLPYGFGAVHNSINGYTLNAQNNWWGSYRGAGALDGGGRNGSVTSVENGGLIDAGSITPDGPVNITLGEYGADFDIVAPNDDTDADDDNDGFSDIQELAAGTDQLNAVSMPLPIVALYVDDDFADDSFGAVVIPTPINLQTGDTARKGFNSFTTIQAAIDAAP